MGRAVAPIVAERFGRSLLELGGNNAMIVTPSADLELAVRAILFAAVGTAGQRCTTLRRLIVHKDVRDRLVPALKAAYGKVKIGDPREAGTLLGPLIDGRSFEAMAAALDKARAAGGTVTGGERVLADRYKDAFYVTPALVEMPAQAEVVRSETFAPILYVMTYETFEQAIALHNGVPQGLSSSIFTMNIKEAERFTAAAGSDCGIANVNIGVRRREGNRRRPRIRLGCLEGLYAPPDLDGELFRRPAAGPGRGVRHRLTHKAAGRIQGKSLTNCAKLSSGFRLSATLRPE
jgi:aldehyde dehydrogenase (NAD+)